MKKLITILILLAIAIGLGLLAQTHPGYVLIQIGHWSIQTSLWFALATLILCLILGDLIVTLINSLIRGMTHVSIWRQRYQKLAAHKALTEGLLAFATEQHDRAFHQLKRYASSSDLALINQVYIVKTRLAQNEPAEQALQTAHNLAEQKNKPYIQLLEAQYHLQQHNWEQTLECVKQLPRKFAHSAQALKIKSHCLAHQKHWEDLWPVLQTLARQCSDQLESPYDDYQKQAFCRIIVKYTKRYHQLKHYWQQLTSENQANADCVIAFLKRCHQLKPKAATEWAESWLNNHYSDNVLQLYYTINQKQLKSTINQLHDWYQIHSQPNISYYLAYSYYLYNNLYQAEQYAQSAWSQGNIQGLLLILFIYLEQQDSLTAQQSLAQQLQIDQNQHKQEP